jgi:hypothetical protein
MTARAFISRLACRVRWVSSVAQQVLRKNREAAQSNAAVEA